MPPPIALEFCCGCARLTAALDTAGFRAIGFDFEFNKVRPEALCLWVDLATAHGRALGWAWLTHTATRLAAFAPPCGTSSRAREMPSGPPPLRSETHPAGLPGLQGLDKVRVEAANAIYSCCALAAAYCARHDILFIFENPLRSIMWHLDAMKKLAPFFQRSWM